MDIKQPEKFQRYSFFKKLFGENTYDSWKLIAKYCVPITTLVLLILIVLSLFFHWGIVRFLLNLTLGTSLIFLIYIFTAVVFLDFGVKIEMEEVRKDMYVLPRILPAKYKFTVVWGIMLIIFGITAIYFSNRYRKHYSFECETFIVEKSKGIYHLRDGNEDEVLDNTVRMKGYELEEFDYTFCEDCKEWAEEAEMEYATGSYFRL